MATISLNNLDLSKIALKAPKKLDQYSLVKLLYNGKKLIVSMDKLRVLKIKQTESGSIVYIKPSNEVIKSILHLQDYITEKLKPNLSDWFKHCNTSKFDDIFVTSICIDSLYGKMMKFNSDELLTGYKGPVKADIRLIGVRIYKNLINLHWNIVNIAQDVLISDFKDPDDCSSDPEDEDVQPQPTHEDMLEMVENSKRIIVHSMETLQVIMDTCTSRKHELESTLDHLNNVKSVQELEHLISNLDTQLDECKRMKFFS